MYFRELYSQKFLPELSFVVVAERSKASDHFRSFGQKMRWGLGVKNFFLLFYVFACFRLSILPYLILYSILEKNG